MEVSPRKLIWADGHALWMGSFAACIVQVAGRSSQVSGPLVPHHRWTAIGRADAVIAQEGQGDPESFAQFWVTSDSCDFVWFQGGSQCACWLLVALDHVASVKSGVM